MSLAVNQFELDGYLFGPDLDVDYESFDPGSVTWRTQRSDSPRESARLFGRDISNAPVWAWSMFVNRSTPAEALETLAALKKVWRAEEARETVGSVVPLIYNIGNGTRMIYGRPNNIAYPLGKELLSGRIDVTADFEASDDLSYGETWHNSGIFGLLPESGSGLEAPLEAPLTLVGEAGSQARHITVGGDVATWALVKFYGPNSGSAFNLRLLVDGVWDARLAGPLAEDEVAILDPRPWVRTALREGDNSSFGGQMSSRMWLMKLTPGTHSLVFTASDPSGTSRCAVSWQEASSSL